MLKPTSDSGFAEIRCHRYGRNADGDRDAVIVEEPLELRANGTAVVTVMRTPGHDRDLALGLLHSEGQIDSLRDVGRVALCGHRERDPHDLPSTPEPAIESGNVVDVRLAEHVAPPSPSRTRLMSSSSFGVCGKRTIEEVLAPTAGAQRPRGARADSLLCPSAVIVALPDTLRAHQTLFEQTGSVHGAALFDPRGRPLVVREDVGRHNAVDKVVGWAFLREKLPLSELVLQVSGRVSFEIVQKAYRAGIPMITAVSGVSTLASELATQAGITLVGFLRDSSFNVYCHPERIRFS